MIVVRNITFMSECEDIRQITLFFVISFVFIALVATVLGR